jgi:hypothetical protein
VLCAILGCLPLFGNHPGGAFLEWLDIILTIWLAGAGMKVHAWTEPCFANGWEWLFVLTGLASIVANGPALLEDFSSHSYRPVAFLISREGHPHYLIKSLMMSAVCIGVAHTAVAIQRRCSEDAFRLCARAIAAGALVTITIGCFEFVSSSVREALDDAQRRIDGYTVQTLHHPFLRALQPAWLQELTGNRCVKSLFWNRGWLAIFWICATPLCLGYAVVTKAERIRLMIMALGISTVFLAIIGARGGLMSAAVSWIFLFIWRFLKGRTRLRRWATLGLASAAVAGPSLAILLWGTSFGRQGNLSPRGRTAIFRYAASIGLNSWPHGVGIEGLSWWAYQYDPISQVAHDSRRQLTATAHNQFLQVFVGQGVPGLACFVVLAFGTLWKALKDLAVLEDRGQRTGVLTALTAGWVAILTYMSVQEWFYLRSVQLIWWLTLAAIWSLSGNNNSVAGQWRKWRIAIQIIISIAAFVGAVVGVRSAVLPVETGIFIPEKREGGPHRYWRWFSESGRLNVPSEAIGLSLLCEVHSPDVSFEDPVECAFSLDGKPLAKIVLYDHGRMAREIKLPVAKTPGGERIISFTCTRTWSPIGEPKKRDFRKLGMFGRIVFLIGEQSLEWDKEARSRFPIQQFETVRDTRGQAGGN